jgi:hypothetical protein
MKVKGKAHALSSTQLIKELENMWSGHDFIFELACTNLRLQP